VMAGRWIAAGLLLAAGIVGITGCLLLYALLFAPATEMDNLGGLTLVLSVFALLVACLLAAIGVAQVVGSGRDEVEGS